MKQAWLLTTGKTNFLIHVGIDFHPKYYMLPNDFIFRTVLFNIPEDKIILPVHFYVSEWFCALLLLKTLHESSKQAQLSH